MMARILDNVADMRRELEEAHAIIRELEEEVELLRLLVGPRREAAWAVAPGLSRTQAVLLALLADGRVHRWWTLGEALERLIGSRSSDFDGFIRTIVCNLRRYFKARGLSGVIETHYRTGYRIAPAHLLMVQSLLWPLDSNAADTPSSDPQPERTNHHVEHKQTPERP